MRWIAFLFIAGTFTTSQTTAKLEKDLVVYFTFDNVKGKKILDASGNDLDADVVANVDFIEVNMGMQFILLMNRKAVIAFMFPRTIC